MPNPVLPRLKRKFQYLSMARRGLLGLALGLTACQARQDETDAATATPPVGHYEGSISMDGQPAVRAALDIRHPRPGHYEAELTAPGASSLGFVADTIVSGNNTLRLTRPARPSQVLTLTQEGNFLRGTLALDSTKATALLVQRGSPTPSTYRVEELPQATGSAWLFAPADTSTPGPALALLPDASTAATAAIWADALAREGVIVLLLPAVDSVTGPAETGRLQQALGLLRGTAGADSATIGIWATGARATLLARELANDASSLRLNFVIMQNAAIAAPDRATWRALRNRKLPVLGLYGGAVANSRAAAMRQALGSRRGNTVRAYRAAGPDLLMPTGLNPQFGAGLPADVVEWLRSR